MLLLVACNSNTMKEDVNSNVIIDWVDFVKINDKQYNSLYNGAIISNEKYIGDAIGEVEFNVNDNVKETNYEVKNGDAAYLKEGTLFYEVKGKSNVLAVKDESEINGYRIYQDESSSEKWSYKNLDLDKVHSVIIMEGYMNPETLHILDTQKEIRELITVISKAMEYSSLCRFIILYDPTLYQFLSDNKERDWRVFSLRDGFESWCWYQWDSEFVSENSTEFIR